MRIVFLDSSRADLRWFKRYYVTVFPEGRKKADTQYLTTLNILRQNPLIGHPSEKIKTAREYDIVRTPFTFIYRVRGDDIEILRVIDNRSDWSEKVF